MSQANQPLELFAIVELFGHQQIAGKLTEQVVAGASMVRVDVPAVDEQPEFTRFFNPSAIYAINPVTQEIAEYRAQQIKARPISPYDIREMNKRLLETGAKPAENQDEDEYNEDADEETPW
ncbi:hypothetical protein GCM10027347_52830 [Larkinella harenae]